MTGPMARSAFTGGRLSWPVDYSSSSAITSPIIFVI
jgi:hypothetical protein